MTRVVIINIIFIGSLALSSCKQKALPPTPPVPVNLFTVKGERVLYYDKYPATGEALSQVNIYPEVQGYITAIDFLEGSHVRKGQLLYEIDQRLFQASYEQAVANLKVAQGNQVQAQQDADRYVYLNKQNAVAEQLYDHAVIALQNAKNSVGAAEEMVKSAKANLSYSVINAPFDGTIGFSQVKLGNMVTAGSTVLNTISTDNPMAVDFLINEKQLPAFEKLADQKQYIIDSLFTILLPDNSAYPYTGKITVIDRAVDAQTGAIRIRLTFPNPKDVLRAGMSCIVRVHNQETAPVMLIPGKAVVEQMGEYFVFVAKDTVVEPRNDSIRKKEAAMEKSEPDSLKNAPRFYAFEKKVQVGKTIGPNVIIEAGIDEGDSIVVDGVQLLHDGSRINVTPAKQPVKAGGAAADQAKGAGNMAETGKKD